MTRNILPVTISVFVFIGGFNERQGEILVRSGGGHFERVLHGRNHWGSGGSGPPPNLDGPPPLHSFLIITDCTKLGRPV